MASPASPAAAAAAAATSPPAAPPAAGGGGSIADARAAMGEAMREAGGAAGKEGWAAVWARSLTLWDLGGPCAAIQAEAAAALADGRVPRGGRALVPGCGTGYDVRALAAQGLRVVGADIVEAAIEAARAQAAPAGDSVELVCGNFFDDARLAEGAFDLVVDYTFFCAIVPAQRAAWGARTARLLRPGGRLLTLMYPLAPDELAADPAAKGPPHPVSLAEYRRALEPHGVALEGEPRASALTVPQRAANEQVAWWRKAE